MRSKASALVHVGRITRGELDAIERNACPGEGACGGMFTANTMASIGEALGMSLPGRAAPPAVDKRRDEYAFRSGEAIVELLRQGITTRDIITSEAFENAIAVTMALGGSTNAVLHLLAIAHEARVELTIDDFNRVGDRTPHLADVKPFGRYVMNDIDRVGGLPMVMQELLDAGLLHGDVLTVTGGPWLRTWPRCSAGARWRVGPPVSAPIHPTGGLAILKGSLAPEGAVIKAASIEQPVFQGSARVFDDESDAMAAVTSGSIVAGDVVVIRYEGPEGRPRHARDAGRHRCDQGRRARQGRDAGHRRAVLRRHGRVLHRPCGSRSAARRADCLCRRRRPDPARHGDAHPRPPGRRRRAGSPSGRAGSRASPATPPASSASTPSSSAQRRRAPSVADPVGTVARERYHGAGDMSNPFF